MWVVKLGGSLSDASVLPTWLDVLCRAGRGKIVVVPGGGPFADQVRRAQQYWRFCDDAAHRMAVVAMQQFGYMLIGLRPELRPAFSGQEAQAILDHGGVAIWLPDIADLYRAGIPANWDVTSDSLAAWLARQVGACRLVLIKSVPVEHVPVSCTQLTNDGIVDRAFAGFIADGSFLSTIYGRDDHALFEVAISAQREGGAAINAV
ncbi:MAG: amino acid kinase [Pseudomonadota bacterium]